MIVEENSKFNKLNFNLKREILSYNSSSEKLLIGLFINKTFKRQLKYNIDIYKVVITMIKLKGKDYNTNE